MAVKVWHYRSTTSGNLPTVGNMANGQIAVNLPDSKIFTSNGSSIIELAHRLYCQSGTPSNASNNNALWFDTTNGYLKVYSNSAWVNTFVTNLGSSANTQLLFNDSGIANGASGLTFNKTTGLLSLGANVTVNTTVLFVGNSTVNVSVNSSSITISGNTVATQGYVSTNYLAVTGGNLSGAVTGSNSSLNMAVSDSTNNGSLLVKSQGTGDSNCAGMTFWNNNYAMKVAVRNDGVFGIGGWSAAAWRWYVDCTNGNMTAAGNVTAYSDPRLKKNFKKIKNAIDILQQIQGGTFVWKNGIEHTSSKAGKKDYGVLADQVQAVMPEIVTDSISIDGESFKMVAYEKLIPVLIEAIKDAFDEIETLKRSLNKLKQ